MYAVNLLDINAVSHEEQVCNDSARKDFVDALRKEVVRNRDRVGSLTATQQRNSRSGTISNRATQFAQLALHYEPCRHRQNLGKAHKRGLTAMCSRKGVVDENVREWCQVAHQRSISLRREVLAVPGADCHFLCIEADVVEHHYFTRFQAGDSIARQLAVDVWDKQDWSVN